MPDASMTPSDHCREGLAKAMAEEFATSLPTDEAGWIEAAGRIVEGIQREAE